MSINNTAKSSSKLAKNAHLNHMAGVSYDITNPITQLRVVASSSFFGEPKYYSHEKESIPSSQSTAAGHDKYLSSVLNSVLTIPEYHKYSSSKLMEVVIDQALDFDPEATLQEAVRLRKEENIRTTPQVIMVRAANHPKVRGTGLISKYSQGILSRTDEAAVQLAYQMQVFGKPIPNALKKSWKYFLEGRSEYELAKYRMENRQFKTVDVVNLVHAKSDEIHLLMKGQLKLSEEDTWEALISKEGSNTETWTKAVSLMGHMALLKNIRNFLQHKVEQKLFIDKLLETAPFSKMIPFEYYSAYTAVRSMASGNVLDTIEKCMEISLKNLPSFSGKVMSLCDNSGSAQEATNSKMGTMKVSSIANLMGVLTGKVADDGYVGIFGDKLEEIAIRKNSSTFDQLNKLEEVGHGIGKGTENGIWLFFDKAIRENLHYDHIFVYSDMQAGHGGLYGLNEKDYKNYIFPNSRNYIDVAKLVKTYREKVNPNVFVYLVQVAGYNDTLVPSFFDRTYILGGWSDKLLKFAHSMSSEVNGDQIKINHDIEQTTKEKRQLSKTKK